MQTQIPLESFWNKKWFSILLTIALFFAIMGILYAAGGETKDFKPQLEAWQSEYNLKAQEDAKADAAEAEAKASRRIRKCEEEKQGAGLKILANATDSESHPLTENQMVDLMKKRDMSCVERVAWIPTAKALSFDNSSFNPQNNGSNQSNPTVNKRINRSNSSDTLILANGVGIQQIHGKLDLDKLAHAVSIAETGGCTKGSAISRNNCFGIMAWKNGVRYLRHFPTKEASFEEFKRIWAKNYKIFPTKELASKWVNGPNSTKPYPADWLNTVKKHYF